MIRIYQLADWCTNQEKVAMIVASSEQLRTSHRAFAAHYGIGHAGRSVMFLPECS